MASEPSKQIEAELLRPAAAPVSTYQGPPARNLQDFAQSLSKVDRNLQGFIEERAKRFREEEAIRGEAAFHESNATGYAEAVRSGRIPAQASRSFTKAYKKAQGSLAGQRLKDAYSRAYAEWDGKYGDDPAAYDEFLAGFIREHVGTDDPDVLAGVLPHVRELEQNGSAAFRADVAEHTYKGSLDAHVAEANRAVEEANAAGLAEGTGTDYPAVFAAVEERREAFIASGGDPRDFDKTMVDAMSAKILATRDPGLLAWFDQKVPGTEHTYGETPYGQGVKQNTINALEVIGRRQASDDAQKQKLEDAANKDKAWRQAIEFLTENPSAPLPDGLIQFGIKYDPKFRVNVENWRRDLAEGFTDPEKLKGVYDAILQGGGIRAVIEAGNQGVFGRPEDLAAAMTFARSFEDNKGRIEDALGSQVAKTLLDSIEIRTKGTNLMMEPLAGMSNEGYEAAFDFRRMVQEWVINNPEASLVEREEAINKIGKVILDRIVQPEITDPGTYDRPEELGDLFDNPFSDGTGAIPQQGAAPAEEPGEGGDDQSFTPEQMEAIDSLAEARGVTREQIIEEMTGQVDHPANQDGPTQSPEGPREELPGGGFRPIAYQPGEGYDPEADDGAYDRREVAFTPEQATALLDEAIAASATPAAGASIEGDELAGHIGRLIRQHEAAGNYNAVYGNSRSKRALSKFTLDDILAQQQAARRRGAVSTATGGYQIIYKTLRGLKQEMGLKGTERFTPKLQDRMFMHLLNRRGYQEYKAGRLSKRAFALRLSQEWASLPNPRTGRSYYAGLAGNASSVSPAAVYRVLGFGA